MSKVPKEILSFLFTVLEFLLMARFILKLLGANTAAPAVSWIYETSEPLLRPFALAFPASAAQRTGVLEYNTLFALFVYAFIGYAAEALLSLLINSVSPAANVVISDDEVIEQETVTKTRAPRRRHHG